MSSCLVVYGLPAHGKTYASQTLGKNLGVKVIHFDDVLNLAAEHVRRRLDDAAVKARTEACPRPFDHAADLQAFLCDLDALIAENRKRFQKLFDLHIRDKAPLSDYHAGFGGQALDLGRIGDFLEPLAAPLIASTLRHAANVAPFFVIEGYYFNDGKAYRKEIARLCPSASFLGCFRERPENAFWYLYNGARLTALSLVEERLRREMSVSTMSYQSFAADGFANSDSPGKLELLGIPANLDGATVLDLGCNEGFFSFVCEQRGAKVIGVEKSEHWYASALKRRNEFSSFVSFLNMDWSELPSLNYRFDLVLFLAAFHYAKDQQLQVLKNIAAKLKSGGLLILEIGLLDKNEGEFLIEDVRRPAGDVCQFTNRFTIEKLLRDAGFTEVREFGKGHNVVGDDVPRFVLHAIKGTEEAAPVACVAAPIKNGAGGASPGLSRDELTHAAAQHKDISLYEVENLLLSLYNRSAVSRWLLTTGYKALKVITRR